MSCTEVLVRSAEQRTDAERALEACSKLRGAHATAPGRLAPRQAHELRSHGRSCDDCMDLVRDRLVLEHDRRWNLAEAALDAANRAVALVLLLALMPLLVALAVVVRMTDGGPAIYRQTRIGQFGQGFAIWKFRTMRVDADAHLVELLQAEGHDGVQPFFKLKNDPRITRVGAFLRKTSLDELPQLVNVLLGHMNLVGPRPQSPAEVATYDARSWRRLLVRPGVTGLWQVSGRSDLDSEAGLELDLDYVRRWTPGLDLRVLLATPVAVLAKRGAY